MTAPVSPPPQRGIFPALGWACFLGSSWTWVIGMVFPILLLRDYGVAGWWVFAIPNVLGAAAMGFVLAKPEDATRVLEKHTPMCVRFSEATIAYHLFVATWLFARIIDGWWVVPLVVALSLLFWARSVRDRGALEMAVATTLVSWLLMAPYLGARLLPGWQDGVDDEKLEYIVHATRADNLPEPLLRTADLWFFAAASLVGFTLCPYLDATFLRARQATEARTGKIAFALGFGVVFFSMILFSLAYAGPLIRPVSTGRWGEVPGELVFIVGTHMVLQAALTIGFHMREANDNPSSYRLSPRLVVVAAVGVGLGLVLANAPTRLMDGRTLLDGEVIYRCFLLLYGVVFPAYVFLVMLPPIKRGNVSRSVRMGMFLFATITALPFAFAGFVAGVAWLIPMSLGLIALARVVIEVTAMRGGDAAPLAA